MLNSDWEPIRIVFDYSNTARADLNFIKYSIMEPIREIFENFLTVKRDPKGMSF